MGIDNRFEELSKSVMFNLSLASKELFHSNFLAYLFKLDNTVFCKLLGIAAFDFDVRREHKNIDIEIIGKNKKYLIENKVKDIIGIEQIEKIEHSCAPGEYEQLILFSLLGNNLELAGEKTRPLWKEIGYEEIIDTLRKHNFQDQYIEAIKNDYCDFLTIMILLLKEQFLNCSKYILFQHKEIFRQFNKIRLHDLFIKYGASIFGRYFKKTSTDSSIVFYPSVHHGLTTMTFYKEWKGIVYGIEIEDTDYRRFIVGPEASKKDFEANGWFDKNWRSKQGKSYLSYSYTKNPGILKIFYPVDYKNKSGWIFWYQLKDRKLENISYDELVTVITNDINILENGQGCVG